MKAMQKTAVFLFTNFFFFFYLCTVQRLVILRALFIIWLLSKPLFVSLVINILYAQISRYYYYLAEAVFHHTIMWQFLQICFNISSFYIISFEF